MKKLSVILLLAIGMGLFLFHSCQKEIVKSSEPTVTSDDLLKAGGMTLEDELIYHKLVSFKKELDTIHANQNYTSPRVFSVDSTCWYLETWSNLDYCETKYSYCDTYRDSLLIDITMNDLQAPMNELASEVDTLYFEAYELFENLHKNGSEAMLIYIDNKAIIGSNLLLKIIVVFGIKRGNNTPPYLGWEPFGTGEDWKYGDALGKCDIPGFLGIDAAMQIEDTLNKYRPTSPCPPGYAWVYYNDNNSYQLIGNEYLNPNDPGIVNYLDYLIFYCSRDDENFTADEKCLSVEEMNFHYFGETTAIHNNLRLTLNKPQNWVNRVAYIKGKHDTQQGHFTIRHHNELHYAYRYLLPTGIGASKIISNIQ